MNLRRKSPMDMTDEEFALWRAQRFAAARYRDRGFPDYADQIEAGEQDDNVDVRMAQLLLSPPEPRTPEFIAAWEEFARQEKE